MIRKIAVAAIIGLLVTAIALTFHFFKKQTDYQQIDTISAIPINSEFFIHIRDLKDLVKKYNKHDNIWGDLRQLDCLQKFSEKLATLDSLSRNDEYLKKTGLERELTIASSIKGKDKIEFLYILPLKNLSEENKFRQWIEASMDKDSEMYKRTFNGTTLFTIADNKSKEEKLSWCATHSLFIVSVSSLLVEDAILQLSSSELLNDDDFLKLKKTAAADNLFNIFINHKSIPRLLSFFTNKKQKEYIKSFTDYAKWTELDANIDNQKILLNGFTLSNSEYYNFVDVFKRQKSGNFEMEKILPSSTSVFAAMIVDNKAAYKEDYKKYLEKTGEIHNYNKFFSQWKRSSGIDAETFFYGLWEKEIAAVMLENSRFDKKNNSFFVMQVNSRTQAKEDLEKMLGKYAKRKNIAYTQLTQKQQIDNETAFTIYKLPFPNFAYKLWGRIFQDIPTNYACFADNYFIAGNSPKSLSKFIYENVLRKTLRHDDFFQSQKKYFSDENINFCFYANLNTGFDLTSSFFNEEIAKLLKNDRKKLKRFQCMGYQLSQTNGLTYNNFFISYNAVVKEKPRTVWQSRLDTAFSMKPALVINHYNGEKEILVQDFTKKLYLISNSGRIVWKNKLNKSINSQIFQVDYFKNGKLQYLFSTENQLHLLDRNGNYVERYPINLRAAASTGMSLFDYDNNKNYRIFIPCKDKNVYAYNVEGSIIPGWKFGETDHEVKTPVQHFRVKGKDYLLLADKSRTYILNRKGEERVKINNQTGKSDKNSFYLDKNHNRILTTDPQGNIVYFYFDGNVEIKEKFDKFSTNHYFASEDFDADGTKDFVFLESNQLSVFSSKGKKLFDYEFKKSIKFQPNIYEFSKNNFKIGVTDGKQIFLFNKNGKLHNGFPLWGKSSFTIGFISDESYRFNLFANGENDLLYNYLVK